MSNPILSITQRPLSDAVAALKPLRSKVVVKV